MLLRREIPPLSSLHQLPGIRRGHKDQVKVKDTPLPVTEIPEAPSCIRRVTQKAKFVVICQELFNVQGTLWKVGCQLAMGRWVLFGVYKVLNNICPIKRKEEEKNILKNLNFQLLLKGKMWPHWVHTLTPHGSASAPLGGVRTPHVFSVASAAAA